MKNLLLICILCTFLIPFKANAQSDAVAAGVAGGLLAIGVGVAAVEQMKESAELTATQWVLTHHSELSSFSLKTLDFNGKKLKDMSSVSVITFKIQEFVPALEPDLNGRKQVLFGFTSNGWITQYGINFEKVKWFLLDEAEWMKMMVAYATVSSGETDKTMLATTLRQGKIVNKGVKLKSKLVIPFYKLEGDMYVITDYSDDLKLLYNERSLGIYLKETKDLVQIARGSIIEIHDFFFED